MSKLRDMITYWVCNFMINKVATPEYAAKITSIIRQGLMHAELGGPLIVKREKDTAS